MKKLFLIPLALVVSFCNCKKNATPNKPSNPTTEISSACPEDGTCTVEIFRNKSLEIKTDGIGAMYYQMNDSPEMSVIHYQYTRNTVKGLQDGSYREEILFEVASSDTTLSLTDVSLQKTKMLFGRHCFCRGQAGYFKVTEGHLQLAQRKDGIQFSLEFKINQVPQIIQKIEASIK